MGPVVGIAGRRKECAAVRRHLETGTGLLLVTGEAGIGKTKLIQTCGANSNVFVAVGSGLPLSAAVPLLPVATALRAIFEYDGGQWVGEALEEAPPQAGTPLGMDPVSAASARAGRRAHGTACRTLANRPTADLLQTRDRQTSLRRAIAADGGIG